MKIEVWGGGELFVLGKKRNKQLPAKYFILKERSFIIKSACSADDFR